jgi:hypothetical protein
MELLAIAIFVELIMILVLCKRVEKLEDYTRERACKKILKKALKSAKKNYEKKRKEVSE